MSIQKADEPQIVFKIGEENKPVVYGAESYHKSIFASQLEAFFSHVRRKIEQEVDGEDVNIFNDVYDNNIIAFIGERGAGKTSCMYSGIKILKEVQENNNWRLLFGDNYRSPVKKLQFMKTIDPSCFDNQHNILEILIGQMYHEVKRKMEETKNMAKRESLNNLVAQFQETKNNLRFLSFDESVAHEDDELEALGYLSSGVELRESIRNLVSCFLDYMGGDILVLGIDDIDLNTSQAYTMVEQIRKYLILPQVMILMAVKLDQLSNVIRLAMTTQFKEIMHEGGKAVSDADVAEMVERYLNKLIPLQARIYLPQPSSFFDRALVVESKDGKESVTFDSVREAVPALIFAKCRYLFYNTRGTTSLIVPRNLRDLRMLIRMLFLMKDYDKNDITGQSAENKKQFKHYLFSTWLDDMSVRYKTIANELINETEPTLFNKKVLELLKNEKNLIDTDLFKANSTLADILNHDNKAYNISVGDTFHILRQLEDTETTSELRKLIFFIKSLYSIRLYEYYDKLTERVNHNDDKVNPKPYRGQKLENVSDFEKMMGGSYFLLEGDTLLPKENGDQEREIRNVRGNSLMKLVKEVVDMYEKANDKKALEQDKGFLTKLRTVEFFMITIARYIWTSDNSLTERGIHKYRLQPKAYYDRAFDAGTYSMMFDILAPFFTLVDIKHCYGRFNEKIYDIAKECKDSLLYMLEQNTENDNKSFLSKVSIRNSEIIDDIFLYMQQRRGSYRMSDNATMIGAFYKDLASYEIYTYDKNKAESYNIIKFPKFTVLSTLFNDKAFVEQFNKIYKIQADEILAVEKNFIEIWGATKSMKGKTVIERIQKNYPNLYDAMDDEKWQSIFDNEKTYTRKTVIKNVATVVGKYQELLENLDDHADNVVDVAGQDVEELKK